MAVYFGFNPPFLSGSIVMPTQADERLIKNDLIQLLLTSPGDRIMFPEYGTPLRKFIFEPGDNFALGNLRQGILVAINRFESRVLVIDLNFDPDLNNNTLNIRIDMELKNNDESRRQFFVELTTTLDVGAV